MVLYSSVCLDKPTHHSDVDFEMKTIRKITNTFGTVTQSQNTYDLNFDNKGDCSKKSNTVCSGYKQSIYND